jgi:hypothetical protein
MSADDPHGGATGFSMSPEESGASMEESCEVQPIDICPDSDDDELQGIIILSDTDDTNMDIGNDYTTLPPYVPDQQELPNEDDVTQWMEEVDQNQQHGHINFTQSHYSYTYPTVQLEQYQWQNNYLSMGDMQQTNDGNGNFAQMGYGDMSAQNFGYQQPSMPQTQSYMYGGHWQGGIGVQPPSGYAPQPTYTPTDQPQASTSLPCTCTMCTLQGTLPLQYMHTTPMQNLTYPTPFHPPVPHTGYTLPPQEMPREIFHPSASPPPRRVILKHSVEEIQRLIRSPVPSTSYDVTTEAPRPTRGLKRKYSR